jgi:hypothetical protein
MPPLNKLREEKEMKKRKVLKNKVRTELWEVYPKYAYRAEYNFLCGESRHRIIGKDYEYVLETKGIFFAWWKKRKRTTECLYRLDEYEPEGGYLSYYIN